MTKTHLKIRTLIECALMIALSSILASIKLFSMPFGGSVTLCAVLPLVIFSFRHGTKWGLFAGFLNSLLQMLTGFYAPPANTVLAYIGVIFLDYLFAFTVFGTAYMLGSWIKNRVWSVAVGAFGVCFLRFCFSVLSGALLWGSYQSSYEWAQGLNVWVYSLIYNGSYLLPEALLTATVAAILMKSAPVIFEQQKKA